MDHRHLQNRKVDEPEHCDTLMRQLEVDFNYKSDYSVPVKLSAASDVLAFSRSISGSFFAIIVPFENTRVKHGN